MFVFCCCLEPQKIDFLVNTAPAWLDFGPQDGPKMGPGWAQTGVKIVLETAPVAKSAPESILGRFGVDFWLILGRCLVEVCMILVRF